MTQEATAALQERLDLLKEQEALGARAVVALGQLYAADPTGSLENAQALFVACSLFMGADPQMASITAAVLAKKLENASIADWYADIQARVADIEAAMTALTGD